MAGLLPPRPHPGCEKSPQGVQNWARGVRVGHEVAPWVRKSRRHIPRCSCACSSSAPTALWQHELGLAVPWRTARASRAPVGEQKSPEGILVPPARCCFVFGHLLAVLELPGGSALRPPPASPRAPSSPCAACAASHKYLPLKEAALSLDTTTSWTIKKKKKRQKERKRKKKKIQPPKKTPTGILRLLPGLSGSHACRDPELAHEGKAARFGRFPSPFPCNSVFISILCSFLGLHAALSYPSSFRASHKADGPVPIPEQQLAATSRGTTAVGQNPSRF